MAVTYYDVIEHGKVVLQYWSGRVTRDDVAAHEHRHRNADASVLVDRREVHFEIRPKAAGGIVDGLSTTRRI